MNRLTGTLKIVSLTNSQSTPQIKAVEIRKLTVAEFHQMELDENDAHLYELLEENS